MTIFKHDITEFFNNLSNNIKEIFDDNSIVFDIETTGFSRKYSNIYLIGAIYKSSVNPTNITTSNSNDSVSVTLIQFFCDSLSDEKECLTNFFDLIKSHSFSRKIKLFSFNGDSFDLPFIKQRAHEYFEDDYVNSIFEYAIDSCDIYKKISKLKTILNLDNYKQKTIELFLNINRTDKYTGGELVDVYKSFLKYPDNYQELIDILTQHNYDDVKYLLKIIDILAYKFILKGQYTLENVSQNTYFDMNNNQQIELFFTLRNKYNIPTKINYRFHNIYFKFNYETTIIRVPIFCGSLKNFFHDYNNYYYLVHEGYAIHKSLATYLPTEAKTKATARTAYQIKEGIFLPIFDNSFNIPFKKDYDSKESFFLADVSFFSNRTLLEKYIMHIFKSLCKEINL